MNKNQLKGTKEYQDCISIIRGYSKGFRFTIPYGRMTKEQKGAMYVITNDCISNGIIESVSIGLDISGDIVEETYIRL